MNSSSFQLHIKTPILESNILSQNVPGRIWLKIESIQPSGSFKIRGIGYACRHYIENGATKLVASSGGNAGMAVANAGRLLGVPVTVVVPQITSSRAKELIAQEGAKVIVEGESWAESHEFALNLAGKGVAYIHPFDDPLIWQGHSTLIDEIVEFQMKPDAIVFSIAGGGILCGILEGLHRHSWQDIPIMTVGTKGADAFHQSLKCNQRIELDEISSLATTLGAKRIAQKSFEWIDQHELHSQVVSDYAAIKACLRFLNDHRILVEPACGASLATIYSPVDFLLDKKNILVIVCGGVGITVNQLEKWLVDLERP